ncbi:hypothetical protein C5B86_05115 [Haloferax sp. Atlit-19N]|uniref:DUF3179 domain-containing (seleno)protein n=1 Tax=Haloferax sp. Atlit-19N TaxID=2077201 RepID=UPI000E229C8F|nr:DUF3179 domain-containing (seleno)protein [Haloferax sp. Atlit-19N]RDZ48426.1 hypothetical protein C5B86_05115 [Haloferax sp. Atlit-19N]
MDRRAFLGVCTAGLAGCTVGSVRPPVAGFPTPENPDPVVQHGFPGTVCGDPPKPFVGIEAILEPAVGPSWEGRNVSERYHFGYEIWSGLSDDAFVIGVERGGAARRVSGTDAVFRVTGHLWQPPAVHGFASVQAGRSFGASASSGDAEVRNSGNLVLYDEANGSYWSQLLAKAICGPRAGERLAFLPSSVTTWAEWRAAHPDSDVPLPPS